MLTPNARAYWRYEAHGRYDKLYDGGYVPARILTVHKRTAHIEVRRRDGSIRRRWVKLTRLEAK